MNQTKQSQSIAFYNTHAESFFHDTVTVNLTPLYQAFLPLLPEQGSILDAGCGSGRDSQFFLEQGFKVSAFDASSELVKKASELLGVHGISGVSVQENTFEHYQSNETFDGIWACASLLHVPSAQLKASFINLASLLKDNGIFYCSFKHGDNDIERNGRYFTNATEPRLRSFIKNTDLAIQRTWLTADARPDRKNEQWLNAILVKG